MQTTLNGACPQLQCDLANPPQWQGREHHDDEPEPDDGKAKPHNNESEPHNNEAEPHNKAEGESMRQWVNQRKEGGDDAEKG